MKHLRQFCAVTILTIVVTLSASAGNINCGVVAPPPPEQTTSAAGEMTTGASATSETLSAETAFVDPVTGLALGILQGLLSLF
jgi:hypothetical protein